MPSQPHVRFNTETGQYEVAAVYEPIDPKEFEENLARANARLSQAQNSRQAVCDRIAGLEGQLVAARESLTLADTEVEVAREEVVFQEAGIKALQEAVAASQGAVPAAAETDAVVLDPHGLASTEATAADEAEDTGDEPEAAESAGNVSEEELIIPISIRNNARAGF